MVDKANLFESDLWWSNLGIVRLSPATRDSNFSTMCEIKCDAEQKKKKDSEKSSEALRQMGRK